MHEVSTHVRTAVASRGADGERWLAGLDRLVDSLLADWGLTITAPLEGGSTSWLARVVDEDGGPAVLRATVYREQLDRLLSALTSTAGRGYVRVLRSDARRGAVLLEALGDSLAGHPLTTVLPIATATLAEAWTMPLEVAPPVDATTHKAATLVTILDEVEHLARWAEPAFTIARGYASHLLAAADPARQVVVHGDPHAANLLAVPNPRSGAPAGYVFIDADLFRCEPEYDLGVLLRDWCDEVLASPDPVTMMQEWSSQCAMATGLDADAINKWAFLERCTTGLYLIWHDLPEQGELFLRSALRLAEGLGRP